MKTTPAPFIPAQPGTIRGPFKGAAGSPNAHQYAVRTKNDAWLYFHQHKHERTHAGAYARALTYAQTQRPK